MCEMCSCSIPNNCFHNFLFAYAKTWNDDDNDDNDDDPCLKIGRSGTPKEKNKNKSSSCQ